MKLTSLSATTLVLLAATLLHGAEARQEDQRAACYELADHVSRRMQDIKSKGDLHSPIGKDAGSNGHPESNRGTNYGNSGERLGDILKGACDGSKDREACNAILGEKESKIDEWFNNARDRDFKEYVCDKQTAGSDPSVMEAILRGKMKAEEDMAREAAAKVEVEDEARKGKKKEEQTQQQQKKEAEKKKQEPVKAKTEQQKESTSPATDPMAIIYGFVNRFKNNMIRVKGLSIDLYGELSAPVKAKQWSHLGALLKNPAFYKKYWYAFLWYAIGLYLTFSIFESLLAKPKPKSERRSGSKRKTASASAKRD